MTEEIETSEILDEQPELIEGELIENEESGFNLKSFLLETIETLVLAVVLYMLINFATARIRVDGSSMWPTFSDGDFVMVNRLAYQWGELDRGDVIVFPYPNNPEDEYIKRVIGLPGDSVYITAGVVYVNDVALDEPYIAAAPIRDYPNVEVPSGTVFVIGDNRNDSADSRSWGVLQVDDIMGKAVFRYYPFNTIGVIEHQNLDEQVEISP